MVLYVCVCVFVRIQKIKNVLKFKFFPTTLFVKEMIQKTKVYWL